MIDIDSMTLGQLKEIAKMFGENNHKSCNNTGLEGKKVIVRSSASGVHYGLLEKVEGTTVTLSNARRLWYWVVEGKKGISLSDVAIHGISTQSKVCAVTEVHIVLNAAEVMTTSSVAQDSIEGAETYVA